MKTRDRDENLLKEVLIKNLDLTSRARFHFETPISNDLPVRIDILIEDVKRKVLVELCHTASWEKLSHLLLARELEINVTDTIVAGRIIPDSIQRGAGQLKIDVIHLPENIFIQKENKRPRGKLTSEKAWRIILHLIERSPCSIRSISRSEGISYGWTHGVITNLISRDIVDRKNNLIEIADQDNLLNAVAWERPLKDLEDFEIVTSFDSTHDLARTLTDWSERRRFPAVMCAYIASNLHFGLGIRSDLVQCYISDIETREIIRNEFSSNNDKGIKLKIFNPDRDVNDDSIVIDGIRITSKEQTVLDIAGLGYSGKDLLIEMVKNYGADSS